MTLLFAAIAQLACVGLAQAPSEEDVLRALVQQYYEAQTRKDADTAAAFWSTSVNPRMSRESYLAVFSAGEAEYRPEIQALAIKGNEARIRVAVALARTVLRNDVPTVIRQTLLNAQLWRRENTTWKLVREGPFAEDLADQLLAAAPVDRPALMAEHAAELDSSLRYVLAQRASALAGQMQFTKAGELFDLALAVARAAKDRRAESETLQNIANAYYFQATTPGAPAPAEAFARATDFYRQRLALAREMADEEAVAASLLGLATVAYSRAEYTPALAFYNDALAIYEKRDEGPSIGRTLVSVGNVQYLQAEYDAATASYRRALGLLLAAPDPVGGSLARSGVARVLAAQGDLAAALDTYGQVLIDARARLAADARRTNDVAVVLESIGEVYFRLGNTDQARAHFQDARQLSLADPVALGRLLSALGLTELAAGRFDAALAAYTESRTRFEQAKYPEGVAHAWVGIGFSQAGRDQFTDAMTAYRTAIRLLDDQKHEEDAARAWLGLSLAQSGARDHEAALLSAQVVRTIADRIKSDDLSWRAAVRTGEALRGLGRLEAAREEFRRGIASIERLAAEAPTNPDARAQLDDSASAWSGLAMTLAAEGDPAGALQAVEARRAHVRQVQLAAFQRDISRGLTPDEQAAEQEIVRELISTRAQLRAVRRAPQPDAARADALQQQLAGLVSRRTEQQARLYDRLPDLAMWRGLRPPALDLTTLVPDSRSLAIEYLLGEDELLIITVARGEAIDVAAVLVPVNRRELSDQIARAMQPAALADAAEWATRSRPIAAAVLAPLASRLTGRERCVIVPDDVLWKVPFEALASGATRIADIALVSYATSLESLALEQRIAASQAPADRTAAAILVNPAIPAAIRAQLALTQPGWKEPDAGASLAAATETRRSYGDAAEMRSGAEASEAAARGLAATADVLQIAAPLQLSGVAPLFSSLVLAGSGEAAEHDGRWEAREWFDGAARARLMVLPDATAFGTAGASSAMDIVAWAAAAAGVPAIVVGRWPVEGFTQDAVLAALHGALAKGATVGEAWSAAIVAARRKTGAAPAGWSGLRLIGASR